MKKVFEYMGKVPDWGCKRLDNLGLECIKSNNPVLAHCLPDDEEPCIYFYQVFQKLDGNDMVQAIRKMQEKVDFYGLDSFMDYADITYHKNFKRDVDFEVWLFGNPENFFKLMEEWLKGKEK